MKYHEPCTMCGHTRTAFTHVINKSMVNALRQLVDWYESTKKPANLQKNLDLTKNQYNNFQKLQYFKVVQRTEEGWFPTQLGIDFIYGRGKIWNRIATIESNILPNEHQAWKTATKFPVPVGVQDIDQTCYKVRVEYQEEKSQQIKINVI